MQAPPRGASRPQIVVRETLLPSDREGRRGREHAKQVGVPVDIFDDEIIEVAPVVPQEEEDVEHDDQSLVRLPTKVELDEGYVFGRDCYCKVSLSTVEEPSGPLTNQRVLNVNHSVDIYQLMEGEAHKDILHMTLRPMSYRAQGVEGAQPIMFDGTGGRTLFLAIVNAWMVEHGFNPEVDLATPVAAEFITGITGNL